MTFPMPPEPAELLQQLVPDRIVPTLIPKLDTYAKRVTVKTRAIGNIAATTLTMKLISSSTSPEDEVHEYYLFMRGGDPEAFMDVQQTETVIYCGISRACAAALDVFLDDVLKATLPETTGAGPWIGYTVLSIPVE